MNPKQVTILLADDDIDDCDFFEEALNDFRQHTQLTVVHNGEELMQYLENDINEIPAVVFLDLNMPRKSGIECLLEIKLSPKLCQIPIIIFSTSLEQTVVNLLYQNGAHYFIRKPPEFAQFKTIVMHSLGLITAGNVSRPPREAFVITANNLIV